MDLDLRPATYVDDGGYVDDLLPSFGGLKTGTNELRLVCEEVDSTCSTPYVSAPSSPGLGPVSGVFYSAPASPMHFAVAKSSSSCLHSSSSENQLLSFEFEFAARFASGDSASTASMTSADELFLNGKIRPMKLGTHLERREILAPLMDREGEGEEKEDEASEIVELGFFRGRDLRLLDKSLQRRTKSMSPLRSSPLEWLVNGDEHWNVESKSGREESKSENKLEGMRNSPEGTIPSVSASSSRSSSAGISSKRWIFLKDFLYRSKSEGRSTANHKFWSNISFSVAKERRSTNQTLTKSATSEKMNKNAQNPEKKAVNAVGKRQCPPMPSPHELHYTANRAQAEEMRKKTFLPYRQGLLGCLGFNSKSYGAVNVFGRSLTPVSSRHPREKKGNSCSFGLHLQWPIYAVAVLTKIELLGLVVNGSDQRLRLIFIIWNRMYLFWA